MAVTLPSAQCTGRVQRAVTCEELRTRYRALIQSLEVFGIALKQAVEGVISTRGHRGMTPVAFNRAMHWGGGIMNKIEVCGTGGPARRRR